MMETYRIENWKLSFSRNCKGFNTSMSCEPVRNQLMNSRVQTCNHSFCQKPNLHTKPSLTKRSYPEKENEIQEFTNTAIDKTTQEIPYALKIVNGFIMPVYILRHDFCQPSLSWRWSDTNQDKGNQIERIKTLTSISILNVSLGSIKKETFAKLFCDSSQRPVWEYRACGFYSCPTLY